MFYIPAESDNSTRYAVFVLSVLKLVLDAESLEQAFVCLLVLCMKFPKL